MSTTPSLNASAAGAAPRRPRAYFARNIPVYYLFNGASGFLIWMPIWIIYLQDLRGMSLTQIATGYINRRIPSDQRATVLPLFQLSAALMTAMILPQVGRVADTVNFQASFGLLLLILVAAGGLFAVIWRRLHIREQTRAGIALNSIPKPQATTSRSRSSATASAVNPNDASSSSLS